MSRFTVLAASGFLASAMMAAPAFAEDSLGQDYPTLDRSTIYQGQPCTAGADCGPAAELTNVKPFYNSVAPTPTPASATVVVPQPTTAVVQTAQAAAASPAAYAAVPFSAAGLSNTALAFGAVGAAALIGIIAVAANDDDDDNSSAATSN